MDKLPKCGANYTPLSPISFLPRAAAVYSQRTSIIYNSIRFTWKQTYDRCLRLASSLRSLNITKNDVVSVLAPNIPAMYEMHFGVPMAGAVLNTINTRLDAGNVATILKHSEAKILFVDYQYVPLARQALSHLTDDGTPVPLAVVIDDIESPTGVRMGELEYEQLIMSGEEYQYNGVEDEWDAIALNYTSGTTSAPKGVVYSHRGAYLSTMSLLLQWGVGNEPVYLWSLPMFHCNGWTFTWGMAARGGTNVCIRNTAPAEMYRAIADHKVTYMCCAPVVFNIMLEAKNEDRRPITSRIEVLTGGAPPPAALLEKIEDMGFHITHAYGMTEATGPALVCEWMAEWDLRPAEERAELKARQGISVLSLQEVDVKDAKTMSSVPRDGRSLGEVVLRGSNVMKGYLKNSEDTAAAFKDGWFLTGDVGVIHPDGYLEIKDRSKDVIISGGENISSVELETVLYRHPMVREAAVVAMPHPRWGETPCAFVSLVKGYVGVTEEDIVSHCRSNMARFMVPKKVVFMDELPKTSTGKILKFKLREMAKGFQVISEKKPLAVIVKKGYATQENMQATTPTPVILI
ncbi:trans-cinnamate:CoA ligase, peroxisomal-like [Dioscorea cayenensis subsp. rotundata]|uniref:4-coumarate--CoA ligase n=1 Tax=Dioscorea cayennensis subsp. rotundata TaxID=55577 RepID=A0AB40AXP2_DIOCR|nr:trans-cinnamate:CoA ligase, peroxisomal-like [Dioscorea cayenensis subsp. rotundata]